MEKKMIVIETIDDGRASIKYSDNLTATMLLEIINDIIQEEIYPPTEVIS